MTSDIDPNEVDALKKRDGRFLYRLLVALVIGALAGGYVVSWVTGQDVGGCAARGFGAISGDESITPSK